MAVSERPLTLSAFADEAGDTCREQIAALRQAGLSFIDIRSMDGYNISEMPLAHAAAVRKDLDAAGIKVAMFGSPIGKIDIAEDMSIDLEKLRHMGQLAPILGCHAIRIFSYYNKKKWPRDRWQKESLARLGQLRDLARQLNLVLYHENERHIFGDLCDDVLTIGKNLRDDVFRLIFDFDNYNQSGEDVWANWLRLRDVTDGIHLKDSKDLQHVPVGEGTGCVREIMRDAAARGWAGPMSIEPHLRHSGAIAATGPGGVVNKRFKRMKPNDSFQIACRAAKALLADVGIQC
jgi:sugar phosphate isomerase/epimerase